MNRIFEIAVGLTARRWRTIHNLNYLAFVFGTVHANLLGANFQDLPVRVVSIAMLLTVAVLFVRAQIEAQRKQAEIRARLAAAERARKGWTHEAPGPRG
jgi:DMSO/TMAO reductase YedYZ heme-binding membrane subunit